MADDHPPRPLSHFLEEVKALQACIDARRPPTPPEGRTITRWFAVRRPDATPRRLEVLIDADGSFGDWRLDFPPVAPPGVARLRVSPGFAESPGFGDWVARAFLMWRHTLPLKGVELLGDDAPWKRGVVRALRQHGLTLFTNA